MEGYFRFGGCRIFYKVEGKGEPVLFVHGMLSDHSKMERFSKSLVKAGFKTILIDLPLHGNSTGVFFSVEGIVAGIRALMRHLEIESYQCVGSSLGAGICSILARLDYRVKSFIAIAPIVSDWIPVRTFFSSVFYNWLRLKFGRRAVFERMAKYLISPGQYRQNREAVLDRLSQHTRRSVLYDLIWASQINCGLNLLYLDKPLMIVMGKYDGFSPVANIEPYVSDDSKVIIVDKSHLDINSDDLTIKGKNLMVEFLRENSGKT